MQLPHFSLLQVLHLSSSPISQFGIFESFGAFDSVGFFFFNINIIEIINIVINPNIAIINIFLFCFMFPIKVGGIPLSIGAGLSCSIWSTSLVISWIEKILLSIFPSVIGFWVTLLPIIFLSFPFFLAVVLNLSLYSLFQK